MKTYSKVGAAVLTAACTLGLSQQFSSAQQPAAANAGGNSVTSVTPVQAGTQAHATTTTGEAAFYILAELTHSLNAKKLKAGDKVNAQVTQDVISHGRIIVPSESRLIGHVTEVKFHEAQDPESRLGLVFDKVVLKHKKEVDFRGVLQALSAPAPRRALQDQPDQMLSPSMMSGAAARSTGPTPMGAGASGRSAVGAGGLSSSSSIATNPGGIAPSNDVVPLTNVPTTYAGNAAGGIPESRGAVAQVNSQPGKPMSVGMPLGVFGLKGLALIPGTSDKTPGPVILSRSENIKLGSGTQVLLRITGATVPQP